MPLPHHLAAALLLATAPLALAQNTPPVSTGKPLAFEVASIRLHDGPLDRAADFSSSGPRVRLVAFDLHQLLMEAYNLRNFQVSFPTMDEQVNTWYDIAAIAPEGTTPTRDEFRRMLQTLLADRFQLKAHFEKKDKQVYALVVAKGGPRLTASSDQTPPNTLFGVNGRNQFTQDRQHHHAAVGRRPEQRSRCGPPRHRPHRPPGVYDLRIEATPIFAAATPNPPT